MYVLATPFTFLEIAVFVIALVAFVLAVRFFIASRKRFRHLLPEHQKKRAYFGVEIDREGFIVPATRLRTAEPAPASNDRIPDEETRQEIKELRNMLQLQQLELTRALRQIESLNESKEEDLYEDRPYEDEEEEPLPGESAATEELRHQLARKEAELQDLRQQVELNQKLQAHFEQVQMGYAELQEKVQKMESQAWQSAELAVQVDSLEQSLEQAEKTVHKKEEKIRELTLENSRLHERANETEDKLAEANLQRQQLMKKVQFLEQINADIQQMTDANRKLKTELRRVAELESMLNLITEERDTLLKRKRF